MRLQKVYEKARQVGVSVLAVVVVLVAATAIGAIWPHTLPWLVPVAAVIATLAPLVASQIAAADERGDQLVGFARRRFEVRADLTRLNFLPYLNSRQKIWAFTAQY